MQHTTKWMMTPLAMLLGTLFSAPSFAVETSVIDSTSTPESTQNEGDTSCIVCKFSGAVYLSYDTNIYDKDDYRSVRNFSWGGYLVYSFSSDTKAYFSTGGYRALEDEVGTYATDSVLACNTRTYIALEIQGKSALRVSSPFQLQKHLVKMNCTPRFV